MGVLTTILNTLIVLVCLFLICLILIQRGKGGGLAGAFGGVGGSSAFGTKAGDTFTKITVVTASIWILMAMLLVVLTNRPLASSWGPDTPTSTTKELGLAPKKKDSAEAPSSTPAAPGATGTEKASGAPPASSPVSAPAIPDSATFPATPGSEPAKK